MRKFKVSIYRCIQINLLDYYYLTHFSGRKKEFPLDIKSTEFAICALTILGQGLQSTRNSRYMDSFAVAIQV